MKLALALLLSLVVGQSQPAAPQANARRAPRPMTTTVSVQIQPGATLIQVPAFDPS